MERAAHISAHCAKRGTVRPAGILKLPRWYDVDTFPDLLRLAEEVSSTEEARSRAGATHKWLAAHATLLSKLERSDFPAGL
ncbi:MAG TPA: hypothetical protein VJ124_16395 [Pyrinomonadaceae bacterium]|nr:hypothetical protein [Pyrinomonadaceae bacterium]